MGNQRVLKEIIIDVTTSRGAESNQERINIGLSTGDGLKGFQLVGLPYHPSEYTIVSTLPNPYL
ncbi:hypothetical protein [Alicyclobacillus ferrooxydans]|uniref:hypothetical protein n=1 Tax=Alicyclobacillus ferrooxydans TaxID=471514 RepID=UPI000B29729E|nr:hypothetical protein [Alicyclobacillus ferrooxydans]